MSVTPVLWSDPFQVNTVDTDLAGRNDQQFQSVIGLLNGNILVVWESNSGIGAGANPGFDLIGQIYEPGGLKVGGEIAINAGWTVDAEQRPSLHALAGGGFAVVYEDNASATDRSIRLDTYDANGVHVLAKSFANDSATGGTPNFHTPGIAGGLTTATSQMITYVADNGGGAQDLMARIWNPQTGVQDAPVTLFTGGAALGGGIQSHASLYTWGATYAVVYSDSDSILSSDIGFKLLDIDGNVLNSQTVASGGRNDDVGIAEIPTESLIVSWSSNAGGNRDIFIRRYDTAGEPLSAAIPVATTVAGEQILPAIAVAHNYDFLVVWYDTAAKAVRGQLFDHLANRIGTEFDVAPVDGLVGLKVEGLFDGRFAVSWTEDTGGDRDVRMAFLDAREAVLGGSLLDDVRVGTVGGNGVQGSEGNDRLYGGKGDDTLDGGGGADLLDGGEGTDTASYLSYVTPLSINLATGAVSGGVADGDVLRSIENLIGTNGASDLLIGDGGNNRLDGAIGNDTLYGGGGNDTLLAFLGADDLYGGAGADRHDGTGTNDATARYDDADWGDLVINLADSAQNSGAAAAGDTYVFIYNATGGAGNDHITGTIFGGVLRGGAGNDTLTGAAGSTDTLEGGAGNDLYDASAGDSIVEQADEGTDTVNAAVSWTLGDHVERLVLGGAGAVDGTGNGLANRITGNEAANALAGLAGKDKLFGGGGNDTLDGGTGADEMTGGAGNDTYFADEAADKTIEDAAAGTDTVWSSVSRTLGPNIEILRLSGEANLTGNGNELDNKLFGNEGGNLLQGFEGADTIAGGDGADTIKGAGGDDSMIGGEGNDVFHVDSPGDKTVEAAGGGTDTVYTAISLVLGANIENLRMQGAANLSGEGNGWANRIFGNAGANQLAGLDGNDALDGKDGNDTLDGGEGKDTLTGGANADVFRAASLNAGADTVTDFNKNADRFDLSGGSFTSLVLAGGDTILHHDGGSLRIQGVNTLSLAQWNALVLPAGAAASAGAAEAVAASPPGWTGFGQHAMPPQLAGFGWGYADFLFA